MRGARRLAARRDAVPIGLRRARSSFTDGAMTISMARPDRAARRAQLAEQAGRGPFLSMGSRRASSVRPPERSGSTEEG
eukprot:scaffold1782_cov414-Prasinococcus_capsulatus_cf.AAC.23